MNQYDISLERECLRVVIGDYCHQCFDLAPGLRQFSRASLAAHQFSLARLLPFLLQTE
jgi:hypothetical protein